MSDKYILDGHTPRPVGLIEWATWFERADRKVAVTEVVPGVRVSTVFLGLNHRFLGDGPPLLFETMIFVSDRPDLPDLDGWEQRYSTWEEAEAGHLVAVGVAEREIAQAKASEASSA